MCCAPGSADHLRSVHLHDLDGPDGEHYCNLHCDADPACSFFVFTGARRPNWCELCTGCAASTTAGRGVMARSWPRGGWVAAGGCVRRPIPALVGLLLAEHLQADYSVKIYRRPNRVRLRDLRVIFGELLPKAALRALAGVGICKSEAAPPFHPFYWGHDTLANPRHSVWIHRTEGPVAAADNEWVEITHCALSAGVRGGSAHPLWAYAAPGSGVSLNVGRTLVAHSYPHATWMLRTVFPLDGGSSGHMDTNRSGGANPLAGYDTLQIVNHREFHSVEARHEIVFLRHHEHDVLSPSTPGLMCGRHPHLFTCSDDDLKRMDGCTMNPHASFNAHGVFRGVKRCNTSHAQRSCFSEHVEGWGDYLCCGALPPAWTRTYAPP